ncbi:MAG: hypothetical protein KGL39_47320 [Patescibacteria group bacterium]|nr:hypothetical protein [Patescibacteria group bacterium]
MIETKDMLEQFPDFIDWGIEWKKSQPYITLHVYLKDDGSDVLPGNCERVEYEWYCPNFTPSPRSIMQSILQCGGER